MFAFMACPTVPKRLQPTTRRSAPPRRPADLRQSASKGWSVVRLLSLPALALADARACHGCRWSHDDAPRREHARGRARASVHARARFRPREQLRRHPDAKDRASYGRSVHAARASPAKCQVMVLHLEARWRQVIHRPGAGMDRVDTVAGGAVEMVMVMRCGVGVPRLSGVLCRVRSVLLDDVHRCFLARRDLEARRLPRQLNADDLSGVLQASDLPVDRRQIQAGYCRLGALQQLMRAQGLTTACKGIDDRLALAGVAFHAAMLMQLHWQ